MNIPDINVWLALVDQNHTHHASAARYWQDISKTEVAFTRVSMLGLLRLSTMPGVLSRPLSAVEAWAIYRQFLSDPNHRFLDEPATLEYHFAALTAQGALPHRLWTDAYLAAFAIASGCRLVSFDADFSRFPGLNFLRLSP